MAQTKKQTNPAAAFLRMAVFNMVVAILFFGFFFVYRGSDGERSVLILVAALVALVATVGSVVAYNVFTKKIENARKKR